MYDLPLSRSGSSPRVWGQVILVPSSVIAERIIPTRVGTRAKDWNEDLKHKDHPHACGDKLIPALFRISVLGSSPRVWGQVVAFRNLMQVYRIIPTRVGTSPMKNGIQGDYKDHPHACGDKTHLRYRQVPEQGSSPRVWGQEYELINFKSHKGIIPTRVGTSEYYWWDDLATEDHPHACGDKYNC